MTPQTRELLDRLKQTTLLGHVGEPLPEGLSGKLLQSWEQALSPKRRAKWDKIKLDAHGDLTSFLAHQHKARYREWKALTAELKPQVLALVQPACTDLQARQAVPPGLDAALSWDLLAACMEGEYADLRAPGFYQRLASLYLQGRFPAGWFGQYPRGELEIF